MSTDLIELIRSAIDEDERIALAATRGPWRWHRYDDGDPVLYGDQDELVISVFGHDDPLLCIEQANMDHIGRFDPKRMLAAVAAKRKILVRHTPERGTSQLPCHGLRCSYCWEIDREGSHGEYGNSVAWPCPDLLALAEGYGITDEPERTAG